jgi:hypothetical protein
MQITSRTWQTLMLQRLGTRAALPANWTGGEQHEMQAIRFHVPTTVARAIGLSTTAHYPGAADDVSGEVEVTDLPWSQVTAIECSVPTAALIVADIERVSDESTNPGFRATCASAMDAAEMAILDSSRNTPPRSIPPQGSDRIEPRDTIRRNHTRDQGDRG